MSEEHDDRDQDLNDSEYKDHWSGAGSFQRAEYLAEENGSEMHNSGTKTPANRQALTGMDRLRRLVVPQEETEDPEPQVHSFYRRKVPDADMDASGDEYQDHSKDKPMRMIRRKQEEDDETKNQREESEDESRPDSNRHGNGSRTLFRSNRSESNQGATKYTQFEEKSDSEQNKVLKNNQRDSSKSLRSKQSRGYQRKDQEDSSSETQRESEQLSSRSSRAGPDRSRASSKSRLDSSKSAKSDYVKKMKTILKKIFHFYACYGSRCSQKNLKPTQFIKMMFDANVADHNLNQRALDLMFLQAASKTKTLEYDEFLELLLIVAARKFKKETNPDAAFKILLSDYLEPLYEKMLEMTDLGIEDKIMNSPLSIATLLVLKMISRPLQVAYRYYFTWETSRPLQEKPSQSKVEAELFNFMKDFEICPQLIAKSSAHSLFVQILALSDSELTKNTQYPDMSKIVGEDLGENFTFHKFATYMVRVGIYIFSDMNNIPTSRKSTSFTLEEKSYLLLERLDISPGISKIMHILQKERLVVGGTQGSGSYGHLNGALGQHRLSIARDSLKKIHQETGAYPNFFPDDEDDDQGKNTRLSKIIKGNKKGKNGQDKHPKTDVENPEEEFMYIKMAKRGSSKGPLSTVESQQTISASSTGRTSSTSGLMKRSSSNSKILNKTPSKISRVTGSSVSDKENRSQNLPSQPSSSNKQETSSKANQSGDPGFSIEENYEVCGRYCDELNQLFKCYCSLGEPGNYKSLRSKQFIRLMKDAGIVSHSSNSAQDEYPLQTQDVDLIFCSILHGIDPFSKNSKKKAKSLLLGGKFEESGNSRSPSPTKPKHSGLDFTLFLKSLEAVAVWVEQDVDKTQRLSYFIENRLLDLLNRKTQTKPNEVMMKKLETKDYFTGKLMSLLRDKSMIEMLSVVHKALLPLYSFYCDDAKLIGLKKFLEFMKDFSVFPQLVSQPKLLQLFHELYALFKTKSEQGAALKEEAIDQHLFVEGLTLLALEIDYSQFKLTNAQKLILLLDRMNDSDASKKISRRLGRTISKKFDIVSGVRERFGEHFKF